MGDRFLWRGWVLALALAFGACRGEPASPPAPPPVTSAPATPTPPAAPPEGAPPAEHGAVAALNDALHTLDTLVGTLEQIRDPIAAWNEGANVAMLMRELEASQERYALAISPAEAERRYPEQMRRLAALSARYQQELRRIQQDPVMWQVLLEEIVEQEREGG